MKDKTAPPGSGRPHRRAAAPRLFTLDVTLLSGPVSETFTKKNPVVSRTIEIRGDQTLARLHSAIFKAFDREEEHLYEFQIGGRRPMDPRARRYGRGDAGGFGFGQRDVVHSATRTRLDSIPLQVRDSFAYWFDFGDDWWHRVTVVGINDTAPGGKYPRVTKRIGESPPQYAVWDDDQ